ncbi:hypothetical protein CYMTET_36274, partial [Cymbomonas tetramitiformis]
MVPRGVQWVRMMVPCGVQWVRRMVRRGVQWCIAAIIVMSVWSAVQPLIMSAVLEEALNGNLYLILIFVALLVIGQLTTARAEYWLALMSPAGGCFLPVMQHRLVHHIANTPAMFLETLNVSFIMTMMESDVNVLNLNIDATFQIISMSMRMAALIGMLIFLSPFLSVVVVLGLPLFVVYNQK